jgi:Glycosyl hydrolase family 26
MAAGRRRLAYAALIAISAMSVILVPQAQSASAATTRLYYGVHVPGWLSDMSAVDRFEADAGKRASLIMFYQGWGLTDGSQNFEPQWMDNIRNHGSIPMVTWEPWLYTEGVNQPAYALQNIANGSFDSYIAQWARDARAWGHPFFLRFAHEMNGNWNSWSEQVNGNSAGQYVLAWQHVHDVFAQNGATNATWVWSPNVSYTGSTPMSELYPGDAYVDWIALDGYNWGTVGGHSWQSFTNVFSPSYSEITAISTKPLLIAETAAAESGGNKANWITSALTSEVDNFPRIKGFVWFNENKETDWRIESSAKAQAAFRRAVKPSRYATNSYSNISTIGLP